jgi:hypothetical protein
MIVLSIGLLERDQWLMDLDRDTAYYWNIR